MELTETAVGKAIALVNRKILYKISGVIHNSLVGHDGAQRDSSGEGPAAAADALVAHVGQVAAGGAASEVDGEVLGGEGGVGVDLLVLAQLLRQMQAGAVGVVTSEGKREGRKG